MGVGLYSDSVFLDMRRLFHMMAESLDYLPTDVSKDTFEEELEERYLLARGTADSFFLSVYL